MKNANGGARPRRRRPIEPLRPNYSNMKARVAEHNEMMRRAAARERLPVPLICPDCYQPPQLCIHRYDERMRPAGEFGHFAD